MKPSAMGTMAVQTELVITPKLAPSLRVTTVSNAPTPWSATASTSRPRWVRLSAGPTEVERREDTDHGHSCGHPERDRPPAHSMAEQHRRRHAHGGHEREHPTHV